MADDLTAEAMTNALRAESSAADLANVRDRIPPDDEAFGLRMGTLFATAKRYTGMPLDEVDRLLDHPAYEPRLAAFCVLDFKARRRLTEDQRRELYDMYLRRHDRITTWDMVDRSAPRVIGGYLTGRSKAPLRELAGSDEPLRRRTAITAPLYFVRAGTDDDIADSYAIAGELAADPELESCRRTFASATSADAAPPESWREMQDFAAPNLNLAPTSASAAVDRGRVSGDGGPTRAAAR